MVRVHLFALLMVTSSVLAVSDEHLKAVQREQQAQADRLAEEKVQKYIDKTLTGVLKITATAGVCALIGLLAQARHVKLDPEADEVGQLYFETMVAIGTTGLTLGLKDMGITIPGFGPEMSVGIPVMKIFTDLLTYGREGLGKARLHYIPMRVAISAALSQLVKWNNAQEATDCKK